MRKLPLVSVIIPVYKVEKYLRCCLDSILAQTYTNLEIILVDDGSPDGCPAICDAYAKKDSRITVIHQKNGGLSAARNAGMERMTGEYVSFLDSDDFVHREYVEQLLCACMEQRAEVAIGNFQRVQAKTELTDFADTVLPKSGIRCVTGLEASRRLCDNKERDYIRTVVAWGKLIKRDLLSELRFPPGIIHEDEATSYRYLYETPNVVYVDAVLYFYRDTPGSIMNNIKNKFSDKEFVIFNIYEEQTRFYMEHGEQKLADFMIEKRYWWILSFYPRIVQAGERLPERKRRLRHVLLVLCRDALRRNTISLKIKLRFILSVPFIKGAYDKYIAK